MAATGLKTASEPKPYWVPCPGCGMEVPIYCSETGSVVVRFHEGREE